MAGGDADEWPEYEYLGSDEERDLDAYYEQMEADLRNSPFVRRVGYE